MLQCSVVADTDSGRIFITSLFYNLVIAYLLNGKGEVGLVCILDFEVVPLPAFVSKLGLGRTGT